MKDMRGHVTLKLQVGGSILSAGKHLILKLICFFSEILFAVFSFLLAKCNCGCVSALLLSYGSSQTNPEKKNNFTTAKIT